MDSSRLFTLPDEELSQVGAVLESKIGEACDAITPEEMPALLDVLTRQVISLGLERVGADEGTIWLLDSAGGELVAAFNDRNPDFIGFRQPLESGLISMVVATEQSCCENEAYRHRAHSGSADREVGKQTASLIAVPLYFGGALRGVMSCVQHVAGEEAPEAAGFCPGHLTEIETAAEVLGRLIDHRVGRRILGLEE